MKNYKKILFSHNKFRVFSYRCNLIFQYTFLFLFILSLLFNDKVLILPLFFKCNFEQKREQNVEGPFSKTTL